LPAQGRSRSTFSHARQLLRALSLSVALLALGGSPVQADDLTEFEAARSLYDARDYEDAVDALRALVGVEPPTIHDPLLVLESRKYLAASLLFIGATEDAKVQFRALLAQEPDYTLDPLAFPTEVLALFDAVKAEVLRISAEKRQREAAERLAAEQSAQQTEAIRRENVARLTTLAKMADLWD
jgi:hypothetical protein